MKLPRIGKRNATWWHHVMEALSPLLTLLFFYFFKNSCTNIFHGRSLNNFYLNVLWGKFTGYRRIPLTKGHWYWALMLSRNEAIFHYMCYSLYWKLNNTSTSLMRSLHFFSNIKLEQTRDHGLIISEFRISHILVRKSRQWLWINSQPNALNWC